MTTTNLYSGIGDKNSSRVLKPPGGGHSNIFGEPDACPIKARPKYNQQNSSNLSMVVGTVDANEKVAEVSPPPPVQKVAPVEASAPPAPAAAQEAKPPTPQETRPAPVNNITSSGSGDSGKQQQQRGGKVPPGGYSAGFW